MPPDDSRRSAGVGRSRYHELGLDQDFAAIVRDGGVALAADRLVGSRNGIRMWALVDGELSSRGARGAAVDGAVIKEVDGIGDQFQSILPVVGEGARIMCHQVVVEGRTHDVVPVGRRVDRGGIPAQLVIAAGLLTGSVTSAT